MCTATCVSTLPVRTVKRSVRCRPEAGGEESQPREDCCSNARYASKDCLPLMWPTLQRTRLPTCEVNCLGCPTDNNFAHKSFSDCGRDPSRISELTLQGLLFWASCFCCCFFCCYVVGEKAGEEATLLEEGSDSIAWIGPCIALPGGNLVLQRAGSSIHCRVPPRCFS